MCSPPPDYSRLLTHTRNAPSNLLGSIILLYVDVPPTFVCGPVYCSTQPLLSPAVTVHQFPLSCFLFLSHLILVALDSL